VSSGGPSLNRLQELAGCTKLKKQTPFDDGNLWEAAESETELLERENQKNTQEVSGRHLKKGGPTGARPKVERCKQGVSGQKVFGQWSRKAENFQIVRTKKRGGASRDIDQEGSRGTESSQGERAASRRQGPARAIPLRKKVPKRD